MFAMSKPRYVNRDIRSFFPEINRHATMLFAEGSVEVKLGYYADEKSTQKQLNELRGYRFDN